MARNEMLNAQIDPMWHHVVLTARKVQSDTLRTIAEAYAENPGRLIDLIAELAAGLDRPSEGWDEAVIDFAVGAQLSEPEIDLDEAQARQLAGELATAAALTFTARRSAEQEASVPRQQDRRAA